MSMPIRLALADDQALVRMGLKALGRSVGILGTCIKEAPEFSSRRRRAAPRSSS